MNHNETFNQDRVKRIIPEFPSPVRQQNSSQHDGAALVDEENLEQGQGRTARGGGDSVVTQEGILEITDNDVERYMSQDYWRRNAPKFVNEKEASVISKYRCPIDVRQMTLLWRLRRLYHR